MLRAFLSFNGAFEIVLFNTFLEHFHAQRFAERMPLPAQCRRQHRAAAPLTRMGP